MGCGSSCESELGSLRFVQEQCQRHQNKSCSGVWVHGIMQSPVQKSGKLAMTGTS